MRHRASKREPERISLFPFLAVLICTMGSLLVLLVVIAQRAQARAQADHQEQIAEAAVSYDQQVQELALLESRVQQLHGTRDEAVGRLADRREALSHVEDHMRRLNEQLRGLQDAARQLQESDPTDSQQLDSIRGEIERVKAQIAESEKLLAGTLEEIQRQAASYAIVPYEGPHNTHRRPIYIECLAETVVLQPEGITLNEHDFVRPLGPDNPLAAVLRTAAEQLARDGGADARPYPLLLVRPSGIRAYYAARAAMQSWDSEFGYELIGEDWNLKLPPASPQLAQLVSESLDLARRRHQLYLQRHALAGSGTGRSGGRGSRDPGVAAERSGNADLRFGAQGQGATSPNQAAETGQQPGQTQTAQVAPDAAQVAPDATQAAPDQPQAGTAGPAGPTPNVQSISETRGKDWALPRASRGSVPFTRPIRIECSADRLVIVPRDSRANWHVIAADGPTEEVVEKFVATVWEHMQTWGIAGRGMYWKPVLQVHPAPDGHQRAAELKVLLDRSGLEVVVQP